jgi:SAM-dependent methyltransferase
MATEVWGDNGVMRPVNYQVLFEVEEDHWWFVGRRAVVFGLIEEALGTGLQSLQTLDIGCGTGATLDRLRAFGTAQGVDLSEIPLRFTRQRGHDRLVCASATELPFAADSFDLITGLDVVEHIDDDVAGLREIQRVLKPGAPAVLFVPAFQSLWGPNDVQSGHKRRYRLPQLRQSVESAGLQIEKITYSNLAMFAPIWLGRRVLTLLGKEDQSENRINHPLINGLLTKLFASEANWLRKHSLPFGVSIVCVARKPAR